MRYADIALPYSSEPRPDRRDVDKAWDKNYDPHYGDKPEGQFIDGQHSFANLRDEMNDRRRQTARRMKC